MLKARWFHAVYLTLTQHKFKSTCWTKMLYFNFIKYLDIRPKVISNLIDTYYYQTG